MYHTATWTCVCSAMLLLTVTASASSQQDSQHGKLLYILLDGFRYDYVDDHPAEEIPGFTEFFNNGVRAKWVNPLYPTLSYPSWTTLVTGLYAESHNIIANYIYDPEDKATFCIDDDNTTGAYKWWTAEPIWTTASKAGLRSALYYWSRCDVPMDGVLPEFCLPYAYIKGTDGFMANIDRALENFVEGYHLVQMYLEHADIIGHHFGAESPSRKQATRDIDALLVYLQERLVALGLEDQINVVIVSDHGMTTTHLFNTDILQLDDYLPPASVESIAGNAAYIIIKVLPGRLDEVYDSLSTMPGVTVYKKEDIPEGMHVKRAKYMHDILLLTDIGHFVKGSHGPEQIPSVGLFKPVSVGTHGYDPRYSKMRAIFYARGPAFQSNLVIEPIDIVDVYQVLTAVLKLDPLPNNGTWDNVDQAFV